MQSFDEIKTEFKKRNYNIIIGGKCTEDKKKNNINTGKKIQKQKKLADETRN